MPNDKLITFQGSIAVEGNLSELDHHQLKDYLEKAVCLDLDTEEHGQLSESIAVTGIGIDWDSLK